jgi:hypothetical protein
MDRQRLFSYRARWVAVVLFTLGATLAMERVFTVEWSFPYCNDQSDGPGWAIFGAPIPYERFAGNSLEYNFVPLFYIVNVLVAFAIALPLVRWTAEHYSRRWPRAIYGTISVSGILLCIVMSVHHVFLVGDGLWRPVASVVFPPYDSYRVLRPVGVSLGRHCSCVPSTFWFARTWRVP